MLLVLTFLITSVIVFSVMAFMTKPTPEQKTVARRISGVIHPQGAASGGRGAEQGLLMDDPESLGWLEKHLGNTSAFKRLQTLILQSQTDTSAGAVVLSIFALALISFLLVYFLTSMFPFALLAAGLAAYLPVGVLRLRRNRRLAAFDAALPDCIELCARALRAGHSIVAAIDMVAVQALEPAKTEFTEVFKKQNYGLPLRDALLQMLERVPSMDLQVMVTGILVQKDTGGNLAEIFDRIVTLTRERLRIQREIRVHTAQGRLTGWILCLLPIALLLLMNLVNPGYSGVFFHDPRGKKMVYAGLVLLLIGIFSIRQIVNGVEV